MISIVICTYNRAPLLSGLLASLNEQKTDLSLAAEILVVDNNSKDNTRQVVETFAESSRFSVRYIFEGRQGVAFARNTGAKNAQGELIAYLDDDVVADENWLNALFFAFSKTGGDVVGGRVALRWDFEKPSWFSNKLSSALVGQDFGDSVRQMKESDPTFITANIGFKKEIFQECGYFQENLGRKGDLLIGGEDREMCERLLAKGKKIYYCPELKVMHEIEAGRLTQKYMLKWFHETGLTVGHTMPVKGFHRLTILPFWAWKEFFQALGAFTVSRFASEPDGFYSRCNMLYMLGILKERSIHSWFSFLKNQFCAFRGTCGK